MTLRLATLILIAAATLASTPADARMFGKAAKASPVASDTTVAEVRQALDEARLLDAGRFLDQALLAGVKDARLTLLGGDLNLARGRFGPALAAYKSVENDPAAQARSHEGQGVILSLMGRSDEAFAMLQKAVAEDPSMWRAWNALGSEYDRRAQWAEAEAAYAHGLETPGGAALVLNNRGYSRLLQHRPQEAVADFVAALQKKPDFPEARTNLRLAMAFAGDYERSIAGGAPDDQAMLLNNAGVAAGARGDYVKAEDLLDRAVALKSEYYGRASENLKIVRAMAGRDGSASLVQP